MAKYFGETEDGNIIVSKGYMRSLKQENAKLRKGIIAVRDLIDDSKGVVGLHENGEVAPWGTLERGGEDCSFECFAMIVNGTIGMYDIGIVNGIPAGKITSIHKDLKPYIEDMLEDLPSNCFVNFIAENITYDEGQQTFPETGQWDFPPYYEMYLSVVKIAEFDQLIKEAEDDLALHKEGES